MEATIKYLILFCTLVAVGAVAEDFTVNVVESTATKARKEELKDYFDQIYARAGIKPNYVFLPSNRGLQLVDSGEIDAEASRIAAVGDKFENLVKVPVVLGMVRSSLFCLEPKKCVNDDNKHIGVQKGFESAHVFCDTLKGTCHFDGNVQSLARLLERGLLDSLLLVNEEAAQILCETQHQTIYFASKPKFARESFHFVHKQHQHLVAKLAEAIREVNTRYADRFDVLAWQQALISCGKEVVDVLGQS